MNEFEEPKEINEAMKMALARAYGDKDLREYLIRMVQASSQNVITCLDQGQIDNARFYSNRAKAIKQLHDKAKTYFEQTEKIRKSKLKVEEINSMV